ncbi:MAG: sulfatase, partial [Acidimicrobiia bacterium]
MSTNLLLLSVWCLGCGGPAPLTVDMPLHLEEHLDDATIVGSEVPEDIPEPVEWRFDEPQPDWRPANPIPAQVEAVRPVRVDDALRLPLTVEKHADGPNLVGVIYIDLPDWTFGGWGYIEIRARTRDRMRRIGLLFNYTEEDPVWGVFPFYAPGHRALLITDGTVQTYRLSLDSPRMRGREEPWTHLGIWFVSQADEEAVTLDILSVRVIPREAEFAGDRVGVRTEQRSNAHRRTLYTHAPGRLEYHVKVPEAGRLDFGLGVLLGNTPVTFTITAQRKGGEAETLLEETYADQDHWAQRSADLSHLAGQTVTLALETEAERAGTVALWAAPTLTGARTTDKPNIIFYIIDGGAADYMSVYGYNRRTTPNLERLAAEGALFERAYSNSTWTKPSTATFMTSLQHSVLGGLDSFDPIPDSALTMAQHMHRAGYRTAVFVANSNAGSVSNLEREVDVFRDAGVRPNAVSSVELHEDFWLWHQAYSSEPYWVHFQTTDVHWPWTPVAPFAGLFINPEVRETYLEWEPRVRTAARIARWPREAAFDKTGISRLAYDNARRGLYDEAMAHNDYQIGRLVERLKARGEWEHTLLIIAADHSHYHAGLGLLDPLPPLWGPIFRSSVTRVPLIVVWPERIAPGQRFSQPVSMIDMLPTVLDLADLPMPEVMQGQSLAPLLLGEEGWEPRPVIFDEFYVDRESGEMGGTIEVVDGWWGASLRINPPDDLPPERQRPAPLLLYDLLSDPMALHVLNEEHPDLVEKYTEFLEAQWEAHQALAQLFTPSE